MNARVILSAVVSALVVIFLGWVVFGLVLHDYYSAQMLPGAKAIMNDPPVLWVLFVSNLLFALLLAVVFERYAGIRTLAGGAIAGLWMGFLVFMSYDLGTFAFFKISSLQFAVVDGLLNSLMAAVAGGVTGSILGFKRK